MTNAKETGLATSVTPHDCAGASERSSWKISMPQCSAISRSSGVRCRATAALRGLCWNHGGSRLGHWKGEAPVYSLLIAPGVLQIECSRRQKYTRPERKNVWPARCSTEAAIRFVAGGRVTRAVVAGVSGQWLLCTLQRLGVELVVEDQSPNERRLQFRVQSPLTSREVTQELRQLNRERYSVSKREETIRRLVARVALSESERAQAEEAFAQVVADGFKVGVRVSPLEPRRKLRSLKNGHGDRLPRGHDGVRRKDGFPRCMGIRPDRCRCSKVASGGVRCRGCERVEAPTSLPSKPSQETHQAEETERKEAMSKPTYSIQSPLQALGKVRPV